jgi:hypothetical protein
MTVDSRRNTAFGRAAGEFYGKTVRSRLLSAMATSAVIAIAICGPVSRADEREMKAGLRGTAMSRHEKCNNRHQTVFLFRRQKAAESQLFIEDDTSGNNAGGGGGGA